MPRRTPSVPAGYSGTPLAKKLGILDDTLVAALAAPPEYPDLLHPLPPGAKIAARITKATALVHLFVTERDVLHTRLALLRSSLAPATPVWVSWPKKTAKVPTDITEDTIRAEALPLGFVDVKVCAVSEVWSALKLVVRKELR